MKKIKLLVPLLLVSTLPQFCLVACQKNSITNITITLSDDGPGSITPGSLTIPQGSTWKQIKNQVIVYPDDNCKLDKWVNENDQTITDDYKFNVNGETITAKFVEKEKYTLTLKSTEGGHIDQDHPTHKVYEGTKYSEVRAELDSYAIADDYYSFTGWYDKDERLIGPNYLFESDQQITAHFEHEQVKLSLFADEGGKVDSDEFVIWKGMKYSEVKSDLDELAIPDKHYKFIGWYIQGEEDPISDTHQFLSDEILTAKFEAVPTTTISISKLGEGAEVLSESCEVDIGVKWGDVCDEIADECLEIQPGYKIENWYYDGTDTPIPADEEITETPISACAHIQTAYFDFSYDETTTSATITKYIGPDTKDVSIEIPSTTLYNNKEYSIVSIGEEAFIGKEGIKSITLGENIKTIGNKAFYGCDRLRSIDLLNIELVGESAFEGCWFLRSVKFGSSITSISASAFNGCESLTDESDPETGGPGFNYAGTIEQWKSIARGESWHEGTPATIIECSDGQCDLDE